MAQSKAVDFCENRGGDKMCSIYGCSEQHTPVVMDKVTLLCENHAPGKDD